MEFTDSLMKVLLTDRSTGRNIMWVTEEHRDTHPEILPDGEMTLEQLNGSAGELIKHRVYKDRMAQDRRTRSKGEVYTPLWIVGAQNDLIDSHWLRREGPFGGRGQVLFPEDVSWQDYVKARRLEITCGEAPYLTGMYDAVSGENVVKAVRRTGLLDRKLRVVSENTQDEKSWLFWAKKAYQSIYGFECMGDSLLLARKNLLSTFADNMRCKFGRGPNGRELRAVANIISWNIWQMDGSSLTPPGKAVYCKVRRWTDGKVIEFRTLLEAGRRIRFNAVAGNPPFHLMDGGAKASAVPIYNRYMEMVRRLRPEYISLIMPARWYSGGKGLESFREEMIHDRHILVMHDYVNASQCFDNVEIKSGVCFFLRCESEEGPCRIYRHEGKKTAKAVRHLAGLGEHTYVRYFELLSVRDKVRKRNAVFLDSIVSSMKPYGVRGDYFEDPEKYGLPPAKTEKAQGDYTILGLNGLKREYRYLSEDFPLPKRDMLEGYKVFMTRNYGRGDLSDIITSPVAAGPGVLCTETFVQAGPFDTVKEAENLIKYTRTRFFRAMVSIRKQDQGAPRAVYGSVPLEDFTDRSDIDWSADTEEIDSALFRKYRLTKGEISFIRAMIPPAEK